MVSIDRQRNYALPSGAKIKFSIYKKSNSQRRSFNEWNDFKAIEFQRYNETERLILYFRLHLRILNRKEISMRTGIPKYQIERFVKAIRTYGYEELS
jgi:hypothetical protein